MYFSIINRYFSAYFLAKQTIIQLADAPQRCSTDDIPLSEYMVSVAME
jgi:hypothetical protein